MGGAEIREARAGEAGSVAALWTEAYVTLGVGGRADPYTEADFIVTAARGTIHVATDEDGGVVGVVALYGPEAPGRVVATAGEAELSRLAVASAERGRGIGRALVAHCESRARAAGWPGDRALEPAGPGRGPPPLRIVRLPPPLRARLGRRDRAAAARLPPRPRPSGKMTR